jgi:methylmalonyl-CoA/ethylmalonyl-CoA epimerase
MKVDHIGIAVRNLEESIEKWSELLELEVKGVEEIKERGVRLAHLSTKSGPSIELLTPCGEGSALGKFLKERDEGIHHFCFEVKNIERAMEELKKKGIQFVQESPQKGAGRSLIAFIHPRNFNSVLIELKEEKKEESPLL